ICFDRWTGEVLWKRKIGSAEGPTVPDERGGLAALRPPMVLSAAADVVVVNTNLGLLAALRSRDGSPLWTAAYRRSNLSNDLGQPRFLSLPPQACILNLDRLIAAPLDSAEVFAIDAASGKRLWSLPLPEPDAQLIGVVGERVLLGGDRLWSVNRQSGELDENWGRSHGGGQGQGVIVGSILFWPADGSIHLIDVETCESVDSPLELPHSGGANLAVAGQDGKYLVAAGGNRLTAFQSRGPVRDADEVDSDDPGASHPRQQTSDDSSAEWRP
ncbi:MAG: PQQ-binding-like beta-propeller repeat protein, partial [Planctomycetota bacterium]